MTAIGLLKGDLVAEDYEDDVASDPRIDELRSKMVIKEDERYTKEYLDSSRESPYGKTQRDQKEGLEFSEKQYLEINNYCNIIMAFFKPLIIKSISSIVL